MSTDLPDVDRSVDLSQPLDTLHDNEKLKARSRHLRGDIAKDLDDALTAAVSHDSTLLLKFFGIYMQDDRELRADRKRRKLEPMYRFMVRLRIPGGRLSREQWLGLDDVSRRYAERGIRITTRQTIQFHGVRKADMRDFMCAVRDLGIDTIAACGDDSRGVVCGANPALSAVHDRVSQLARATSNRLIPKTRGYREIWYRETPIDAVAQATEEPVYGDLYLPRKFKVGYAIPPNNDIDVYGQDLGLIAVVENGELQGFNVCVGGGMGQLDTREDSYPRLAEQLGFLDDPDAAPAFAECVMTIQRDFGDRKDRHRARFKYTLDRLGNDWFLAELERRWGKPLAPARAIKFTHNGDPRGWHQGGDGLWHATLHIDSGRIIDQLQDDLRALVKALPGGGIRMTCNQNWQLSGLTIGERTQVHQWLEKHGLAWRLQPELQAAHTLSCVALPTCGLAMAEAERYTPDFLAGFNALKAKHGINEQPITLRISGCPNGCARPYIAEIALTGRAPGLYNLYIGGSFHGDRLAKLVASNVGEKAIFEHLDPLFAAFAQDRQTGEHFGDFLVRTGR